MNISQWCDPDNKVSCVTNTTLFTSDDPILCKNETFWQTINTLTSAPVVSKQEDTQITIVTACDGQQECEKGYDHSEFSHRWLWKQLEIIWNWTENYLL